MKPIHDMPLSELEDEELVVRSRTGDVGAFRGIATRYYSLIYTMAYEATGSADQSDELAGATFVAAWRRGGVVPGHFGGHWAVDYVRNCRQPQYLPVTSASFTVTDVY